MDHNTTIINSDFVFSNNVFGHVEYVLGMNKIRKLLCDIISQKYVIGTIKSKPTAKKFVKMAWIRSMMPVVQADARRIIVSPIPTTISWLEASIWFWLDSSVQ